MSEALAAVREIRARQHALVQEMQAIAKTAFTDASATIFANHPTLQWYSWTQYTPYFNDGEECVFRVNRYYQIGFVDGTEDSDCEGYYARYKIKNGEELTETDKIGLAIDTLMREFSDDDFRTMFGNHVRVTVDRTTGTVVDDCEDHD